MEIADTSAEAEQNMYYNVHAEATLNSGWNEVVFDFANPVIRWVDSTNGEVATPISEDATYDKINLFIDWNNGKDFAGNQVGAAITQDVTYYVDDVVMGFGEPVYYQGGSSETEQEPNISSEPTVAPDALQPPPMMSSRYSATRTLLRPPLHGQQYGTKLTSLMWT